MDGAPGIAAGLFQFALLCIAPTAILWVLLNIVTIAERATELARRLHLLAERDESRPGPPIEQIAADIRRIAAAIDALPSQTSVVKRRGAILAYDDALAAACRALGVDDTLTSTPSGSVRDTERLRIECELEHAGLVIRPPRAA